VRAELLRELSDRQTVIVSLDRFFFPFRDEMQVRGIHITVGIRSRISELDEGASDSCLARSAFPAKD
jgi:hypothetical protein